MSAFATPGAGSLSPKDELSARIEQVFLPLQLLLNSLLTLIQNFEEFTLPQVALKISIDLESQLIVIVWPWFVVMSIQAS